MKKDPLPDPALFSARDLQGRVIHEDGCLRALNKPSGLSVLLDNTGQSSVSDLYEEAFGERAFWVHRIDKGTSGILLVARNQPSRKTLQHQFERGSVEKTYLARVEGVPHPRKGTLELPLEKARKGKFRIAPPGKGLDARTDYEVLQESEGNSLLVCHPRTGRTHQIRVHLQALGCPLLKDPLYGRHREKPSKAPSLTLHAWKIAFDHPDSGKRIQLTAPLPSWAQPFPGEAS